MYKQPSSPTVAISSSPRPARAVQGQRRIEPPLNWWTVPKLWCSVKVYTAEQHTTVRAHCVNITTFTLHPIKLVPKQLINNNILHCIVGTHTWHLHCQSKKSPEDLWQFFQNGWEFFNQILHAYYAFLSMLDYKILFNYPELWRSHAVLSVTTQFTSCAQNVHNRPKCTLAFSDIFPKQLGIFCPNFTRLLNVYMYAWMQIFIQLSPTVTKLCHIKCDHPACDSVDSFWAQVIE